MPLKSNKKTERMFLVFDEEGSISSEGVIFTEGKLKEYLGKIDKDLSTESEEVEEIQNQITDKQIRVFEIVKEIKLSVKSKMSYEL